MIYRVYFIKVKTGEKLLSIEYDSGNLSGETDLKLWGDFGKRLGFGDDVKIAHVVSPKNALEEKLDELVSELRGIRDVLLYPEEMKARLARSARRTCDFEATAAGGQQ